MEVGKALVHREEGVVILCRQTTGWGNLYEVSIVLTQLCSCSVFCTWGVYVSRFPLVLLALVLKLA